MILWKLICYRVGAWIGNAAIQLGFFALVMGAAELLSWALGSERIDVLIAFVVLGLLEILWKLK